MSYMLSVGVLVSLFINLCEGLISFVFLSLTFYIMEFNFDNRVLGAHVFGDATEQLLDSVDKLKLDSLVM